MIGCQPPRPRRCFNVGGDCNQGTAYGIVFTDANIVNVAGCRFNTIVQPAVFNRINIGVSSKSVPPTTSVVRLLIAHNQFGDTAASCNFGVSAVKVLGTAGDIQIGHNDYIGTYTGPVVDDQTGTGAVVATLGYPSPSTTIFSAVIPNGGGTKQYPTLGSANAVWAASFSMGHYLPGGCGDQCGTVFELAPDGTETVLYRFRGPPKDGNLPTRFFPPPFVVP